MNNLHRELAPVSAAAWAGIEEEAKRTFARHAAARKSVDVTGPDGPTLAGVGTGHSEPIDRPRPASRRRCGRGSRWSSSGSRSR